MLGILIINSNITENKITSGFYCGSLGFHENLSTSTLNLKAVENHTTIAIEFQLQKDDLSLSLSKTIQITKTSNNESQPGLKHIKTLV